MKRNIEVVAYNFLWPEMFALEATLIKQALGNNCITIHHIGSTSVPELRAKPIIDILPVIKDIQEVGIKRQKQWKAWDMKLKANMALLFVAISKRSTY